MDLDQEARRATINTRCHRHLRRTDSHNISNIQREPRNPSLLFTSNLCRSTRRAMRRNEVTTDAINQCVRESSLAINLIVSQLCTTTLGLAATMRQIHLTMAECHHEPPLLKANSQSAENRFLQTREPFHLPNPRHNMYSRKHLTQMSNLLAPIQSNNSQKVLIIRNPMNTIRRSRGVQDHQESAHRLIRHQNLKQHHHHFKSHTVQVPRQHALRICRSRSNLNRLRQSRKL